MMKAQSATPFMKLVLVGCVAGITLWGAGCSLFGGEDSNPRVEQDVCEDAFNRFVTQHANGLGVTSEECVASERGQWIEGRCYCHGVNE